MKPFLLPALSTLVLLHAGATMAAAETQWMKVILDGRKVGQLESIREVDGERVISTERMTMTVDRAGISLPVKSEERAIETLDGKPLAFMVKTGLSGMDSEIEGTLDDNGQLQILMRSGSSEQRRSIAWPSGAVLPEGARLAEERAGLDAGVRYSVLSFQPSTLQAIPTSGQVIGTESVMVEDGVRSLVRIDQVADMDGTPLRMSVWVDAEHTVLRASMPLMGMDFVMLACSEACATAPNQSADVLERAMVSAPRALDANERAAGLEYTLRIAGQDAPALPSIAEQHSERRGELWSVRVEPRGTRHDSTPPTADDRSANRWLNHDDPAVIALAERAAGKRKDADAGALMQRLEDFVRDYIHNKSMRIGYASAAETVASREGDCTEHAVLLAALGRALDVPTRVVNGLAYAPAFAGREQVFVPHAWVQAWDGKRWRSYDAALAGFDAGHIALSIGDGDASGFYGGVALLGNVSIEAIAPLEAPVPR